MSEHEENINGKQDEEFEKPTNGNLEDVIPVSGMYQSWFLDYASYVILERAIPAMDDGLKPVQRRILHSMKELDDGRYHKVANLIGHTMKYHPHGDASIGDALVQLGQKELLVDTQGNWGNTLTGDRAAAARYIEARLTKFALEVVFNHKTTKWQASYDGRGKEPVHFPVKFPLLLAQGAEGIAVGLSTKIMPHNFNELIDASVKILKGKSADIIPDFPSAGMADFSQYNEGMRGSRIRVRARINQEDKKTLRITEIPFGTTTTSLIESIIKANEKGKIKIKKIEDNTAEFVEVLIHLPAGISPDKMIDALYAFTDCEVSVSPNCCVIEHDKPRFVGVNEMLKISTEQTVELLKTELIIRKSELEEQWHFASLEQIFIEKRIYRDIEKCETWESIIETIRKGLKPHVKKLLREVTDEDIARLTEIKIKRISKFDSAKADDHIQKLEEQLKEVKLNLKNLTEYAIDYFKNLKKKYGKDRGRKTEIKSFDTIQAAKVAVANVKLYVDMKEGFIGYGLKRLESEFLCDCSDIDDLIIIRGDGIMLVTKIADKTFVGKDILYAGVWKKGDERTIYNLLYEDGPRGNLMMKRFAVTSITRDKEYELTKGAKGTKVLYLTANPNGEAEVVTVMHRAKPKLKRLKFDFDFGELAIKGRAAKGNILTRHKVNKVILKEAGLSTLGARKIWFDDAVQRLNTDDRGEFLGEFMPEDKILTIMQSGEYQLTGFDLYTKFEEDMILIEKWNPEKPVSAIYLDGEKEQYFVKRFLPENTPNKISFITSHKKSQLEILSTDGKPRIEMKFAKENNKEPEPEVINLEEFIAIKGIKALGNRLSPHKVKSIDLLEPLPSEAPKEEGKSEKKESKKKFPKDDDKSTLKQSPEKEVKKNPPPTTSVKNEVPEEETITIELSVESMKKADAKRKKVLEKKTSKRNSGQIEMNL